VPKRISLPEVTICAADTAFVDLTVRALKLSTEGCAFGDAILFSDVERAGPFRCVSVAPMHSIADYSRFILRDLAGHIKTSHVLVIQWDGYVVHPAAWKRLFLRYDYIGSVWPGLPEHQAVGNGGFSLRSRRLMEAVGNLPHLVGYNEDIVIARSYRAILERDSRMRFAPTKVARQFAQEYEIDEKVATFGFHALENLGRYNSDDELSDIGSALDLGRVQFEKALILAINCSRDGHPKAGGILYRRLRALKPGPVILRILVDQYGPAEGERTFHNLEAMGGVEGRSSTT
jgi:hypothetical protein